jgi:hypothetical protein
MSLVPCFRVSGFGFVDVPDRAGFAELGSLEESMLQIFDEVVETA